MKEYRFGVDVGGTKVAYGLYKGEGEEVDKDKHSTPEGVTGPQLADLVIEHIGKMMEKNGLSKEDIAGIGICMPSYINFEEGYIVMTASCENVREFAMRDYMVERLGLPVVLDNDANVAALAEHRFGAGVGSRNMVYLATSTGLGGGFIINGELYRGTYGWAGEVGHMLITPGEGPLCGNGDRGNFESWVGGKYIPDRVELKGGAQTSMGAANAVNGEILLNALKDGDSLAKEIIDEMGYYLGICIYNLYELLNINIFVCGGGLTHFGDALYGKAMEVFNKYNKSDRPIEIKMAKLEQDFGIIGAAELVR